VTSPDQKKGAFIRNDNLWVREVASGEETQLTTDGVKDFSYALDNAGGEKSGRPILLWSPDSKKIATFQAGPTQRGRDVPGGDPGGASHPGNTRCPATSTSPASSVRSCQ